MDLPPLLIQTAGSLAAILLLAGLAWWLGLGRGAPLMDDVAVQKAAHEAEFGFDAVVMVRDAEGHGALARDAAGRIMVIRRHGNRFAARILGPAARAAASNDGIAVDCGEARFGPVRLRIADSEAWAAAINRLDQPRDA